METTTEATTELTAAQAEELARIKMRVLWLKRFIAAASTISTGYAVGSLVASVWTQGLKTSCK
jgi:hypothetical protein